MGKIPVDDYGLEVVRKAAQDSADGTKYDLRVSPTDGMLAGLTYDYVEMAISPATTETYTFKTGGASGTTVATVVIVYTDSTRADISTVTKT